MERLLSRRGLYWKPVSGTGGEEQLLDSSRQLFPASVTSDGKYLIYGGAVALVIVSTTLRLTRAQGKDGLTPTQGLDLAFLIEAQHEGMMRRVHVEADDVAYLLHQQRIVGQLEGLAAMRA